MIIVIRGDKSNIEVIYYGPVKANGFGMRRVATASTTLCLTICSAWGQAGTAADEVSKGHNLAVKICATCHVAVPDQVAKPLLNPPARSFASIAQRNDLTAAWLENFIATTHRSLDNPKGMPNPDLAAYQVKEVATYLMSLRK